MASPFETTHTEREAEAIRLLDEAQVVARGHFVYKSGLHGNAYVQKDKTISDPALQARITELMAGDIAGTFESDEVDSLVGIAPCSSMLASRIAEHLGTIWGKTPSLVFAEKVTDMRHNVVEGYVLHEEFQLKRGFDQEIKNKKVLLIEDVVTTGGSLVQVRDLVNKVEGVEIVGAAAEWSRSPEEVTAKSLGLNIWLPLVSKALATYQKGSCPMDADLEQFPIRTDLGHGAAYLVKS